MNECDWDMRNEDLRKSLPLLSREKHSKEDWNTI